MPIREISVWVHDFEEPSLAKSVKKNENKTQNCCANTNTGKRNLYKHQSHSTGISNMVGPQSDYLPSLLALVLWPLQAGYKPGCAGEAGWILTILHGPRYLMFFE